MSSDDVEVVRDQFASSSAARWATPATLRGAVDGLFPIFFPSMVPVVYLLYFAWCVIRQAPEAEETPPGADGHDPRRWRRDPRRPRDPRRGPHTPGAQRLPKCPPGGRFRVLTPPASARAKVSDRH